MVLVGLSNTMQQYQWYDDQCHGAALLPHDMGSAAPPPHQQMDTSFPGKDGRHRAPRCQKDSKGRPGRLQRRKYQDYVATLEAQAATDPVSFDIEAIELPPYIKANSWLASKCKARVAAYLEAMTNASSEGHDGTDGSLVTGEEMLDEVDANPQAYDQEKQMLAPFLNQKVPKQLSDSKQLMKKLNRRVQQRALESKYRQGCAVGPNLRLPSDTLQDAWLQPMLEAGKLSQSGQIPQVGPWKVEVLSF